MTLTQVFLIILVKSLWMGGVKNEELEIFENIGVDVVVQGGAIFG